MGPSILRALERKRAAAHDDAGPDLDSSPSLRSSDKEPLSPREDEMMQLFLAGDYSEAAERLGVSEQTVRAQAPILMERWERRRARDTEQGTSGSEHSHEVPTHTETVGGDEAGTPRASPTGRQIAGKGKPQPHKRRDRR